jgi:protein transport protein SEC24
MFLWVGANVSLDWSHNVFGDHIVAKIDIDRNSLPNFDNPVSQRLRQVIEMVRSQRQYSMKVILAMPLQFFSVSKGQQQGLCIAGGV